jgi:integrase
MPRHSTERLAHSPPHLHNVALAKREQPKVVQDLLKHASYGITMNVYDSVVSDEKREAHSRVMRLVATRTQTRTGPADDRMATA